MKDVRPLDQIDMHIQAGEMVYSTFTWTAITSSKLHLTLSNVKSQLKLEKVSPIAKDTRIKYLEEMVIKVVFDLDNSKSMEEIIRKKNTDIVALKKQLKWPAIEDPQAKLLGETEIQKEEMLKPLVEQNAQIKEM